MSTTYRLWLSPLVAALLVSASAVAQVPRPPQAPRDPRSEAVPVVTGTASISGSVATAGQPARGARVNLSSNDGPSRSTTTDDMGRFSFTALPSGRYTLSAQKTGHIGATYGQSRPGRPGTAIQLGGAERFEAQLQIYKGGVLTGTILDEHGEAMPGMQIRGLRYVMTGGQRTLQQSGNGATDDRGIYRLYGLQPGDYVICAMPRNTDGGTDRDRLVAQLEAMQRAIETVGRTDETQARELAARAAALRAVLPEQDEPASGYATVYYPGTVSSGEAAAVPLGAGEEKTGLDFQLQRVPVARVDGTVTNPAGHSLQNIQIALAPAGGTLPGVDNYSARADNDGRFRFQNVPPGQYTLVAQGMVNGVQPRMPASPSDAPGQDRMMAAQRPEPPRFWATVPLSVDGRNISNVVLSLQPGMTLSGKLAFEGTTLQPPADLSRVRVSLAPADASSGVSRVMSSPAAGRVDAAGRFTISSVLPGKYRLTGSNAGAGWFLESSVVEGQNTLDAPFEIKPNQNLSGAILTYIDRQTELTGVLTNERNEPAPGYTIVVYPSDQRYWMPTSPRIRTTRPATDGSFKLSGLPPGEYRIATLGDVEPGSWYDPAFLQQLDAGALRVAIGDGEKKSQNLRVR